MRIVFAVSVLLFLLPSAHAANSYRLNASASQTINEQGICRNITNSGSRSYMIPTKTNREFKSFVDNPPVGISMSNCCASGFVLVPASTSKGTAEFCVMKWEARTSGSVAVATSTGLPSSSVSKAQAISRCQAMGAGYNLVSNDQWTAMARDIEGVNSNWSGGARGVGCLKIGATNADSACHYRTSVDLDPEAGEANTLARHTFSNGQEIWHLGGNLAEWVSGTVTTSSAASSQSSPYVGARAVHTFTKLPASDRTNFGPLFDDYGAGCGSGDQTYYSTCGVGYFVFANGSSNLTRGSESHEDKYDTFTLENYPDDSARAWVGYRCAYTP